VKILIASFVVLIVIAVALALTVSASLNNARDKGQEATAMSSLSMSRVTAELYYDMNEMSYAGVCDDSDMTSLLNSASESVGSPAACQDSETGYRASVTLISGDHFCVDSLGNAKTMVGAAPTGLTCE